METLFDNAVKYSADGGEIRVNAVMENQKVILEIKDEGRGFSNESIEKIFSLFATGEGHLDNNTGLSLALVKMIMDAHGGHIDVGNNEDKGAFVKLSFAV